MASGLPIVGTRHSGIPDQVHPGVNGFLALENNPQALAEAIIEMLEHSERWPEFSRASQKIVNTQYNSQELISEQIKIYARLLDNNNKLG